jgi:cytochrome b561
MIMKNTQTSYGSVSKWIHWVTFLFIAVAITVPFIAEELPKGDPLKGTLFMIHKSCGISVLGIVILRLLWRLITIMPAPVRGLSKLEMNGAKLVHFALYVVMIAMPLSGLVFSKYPINFFNLYDIPNLIDAPKFMKDGAHEFHEIFASFAIGFIALHILAALWHHYIRKDETLKRMLAN